MEYFVLYCDASPIKMDFWKTKNVGLGSIYRLLIGYYEISIAFRKSEIHAYAQKICLQ